MPCCPWSKPIDELDLSADAAASNAAKPRGVIESLRLASAKVGGLRLLSPKGVQLDDTSLVKAELSKASRPRGALPSSKFPNSLRLRSTRGKDKKEKNVFVWFTKPMLRCSSYVQEGDLPPPLGGGVLITRLAPVA